MAAFEDGEKVTDEHWEEAYAWAHGEEPQVSLSLMQRYVKWLNLKSNCALAGLEPPSPFNVDIEEEDAEEGGAEEDDVEDEEGTDAEEDESEEEAEDAATK